MRKGGIKATCLIAVLMVIAGLASADDRTVNLESKIIQSFDTADEQHWFLLGSKFASIGYPKLTFLNAFPAQLYGYSPANADKLMALGIAMMFDRKEYNWVDVVPGTQTTDSAGKPVYNPQELPLPGRVKALDLWVWGSGFRYYMEVYVRDFQGIVHTIPMGMIDHDGWKDIRVEIPTNISQEKPTLPKREGLSLVKFRIWTTPTEAVAVIGTEDPTDLKTSTDRSKEKDISKAIFVYFDQVKILTDTFETLYDGDNLTNPDTIRKAFTGGSSPAPASSSGK